MEDETSRGRYQIINKDFFKKYFPNQSSGYKSRGEMNHPEAGNKVRKLRGNESPRSR
jgi:hypothetical protein